MVIKRSLPTWSVILVVVVVVAAAAGFILFSNPGLDKDTLVRLRTKPGSSVAAPPTGLPRGTPIIHAPPGPAAGSRQKPTQG